MRRVLRGAQADIEDKFAKYDTNQSGKLEFVFVELFHHEDPALEALRQLDSGHGIDTTDGRSYSRAVVDGLIDVARRLNNLKARGMLD